MTRVEGEEKSFEFRVLGSHGAALALIADDQSPIVWPSRGGVAGRVQGLTFRVRDSPRAPAVLPDAGCEMADRRSPIANCFEVLEVEVVREGLEFLAEWQRT